MHTEELPGERYYEIAPVTQAENRLSIFCIATAWFFVQLLGYCVLALVINETSVINLNSRLSQLSACERYIAECFFLM